jgi:hypothetical protein
MKYQDKKIKFAKDKVDDLKKKFKSLALLDEEGFTV